MTEPTGAIPSQHPAPQPTGATQAANPYGGYSGDPYSLAHRDAQILLGLTGGLHFDVAVVVGTGWQPGVANLGQITHVVPISQLSGFSPSSVPGHLAELVVLDVAGARVLLLHGRMHLYEGYSPAQVVHPVRTAIAAGARTVILTNASGTLRSRFRVGDLALIADHINLTGQSPLTGPPAPPGWPDRFVNLVDLYSPRMRRLVRASDLSLKEGVYAGVAGPHLETPAEIRMMTGYGADFVGMSTVLEAIAARHLGAEILGVSLITNVAVQLSATVGAEDEFIEATFGIGDIYEVGMAAAGHCASFLSNAINFRL